MITRKFTASILVVALAFCGTAWAAGATDQQPAAQEQKQIYGSQLMTEQERTEHRARMRAAKTIEEREQIRKEHHKRMKERATERGVTLSEEPPAAGRGMGYGSRR